MRKFEAAGRSWSIDVNYGLVQRLKSSLGINLLDVVNKDGELLKRLCGDLFFVGDLIIACCAEQLEAENLRQADLARGLAGEAFERAWKALWEELIDFFPDPRTRDVLGKTWKAVNRMADLRKEKASLEIERIVEEWTAKQSFDSDTNMAESSASPPKPSRSGN